MDVDKAIKERHSVRKFSNKKPDWRKIIECVDAMRYAPMAGNNFTLKIIIVEDKEKIQQIADACQQNFIGIVNYIVVVCSDNKRLVNAYEEKGEKFNRQQVGAAMENFLLEIEDKGLATCWVGYFEENMIKRSLRIPSEIQVEAIFPIGYEFEKQKTKREKVNMDGVLYFDEYKNKKMKKPNRVD